MDRGDEAAADRDETARIEGYLRGDAEVFAEVDGWIRSELRRRYPGFGDENDDLAQTVHRKLLGKLRAGRFEGRSGLRTYVTGIVHHSAIDRLRAVYRQRALADSLVREPSPRSADPYRAIESRDEIALLYRALASLSEPCRELWRLVFVERLPYEEIGRRLSIPPGTVKSRMWHCRRRATRALERLRRAGGAARSAYVSSGDSAEPREPGVDSTKGRGN